MNIIPPASLSKMASGTYAGDGTQNKAIAHGLGTVPRFVFIYQLAASNSRCHFISETDTDMLESWVAATAAAVTAMTSVNFYVGTAVNFYGNINGVNYAWVAWA